VKLIKKDVFRVELGDGEEGTLETISKVVSRVYPEAINVWVNLTVEGYEVVVENQVLET